MRIVKKKGKQILLFNSETPEIIIRPKELSISNDENIIPLNESGLLNEDTELSFLQKYFDEDSLIFNDLGDSYYYHYKSDNVAYSLIHDYNIFIDSMNYIDRFIKPLRVYGYFAHRVDKAANVEDDTLIYESVMALNRLRDYMQKLKQDSNNVEN